MSESNRLQLAWVREVTRGTTPNSPRMRVARIRGESLAFTPQFQNSEELRADRMQADPVKVNERNEGGINFELSYPAPDSPLADWFASALLNDWVNRPAFDNDGTADSVIDGVTDSSDTFSVAAGGAACVAGHLLRMSGFSNPANNGLFAVESSTATSIVVAGTPSLTDEAAPPGTARIKVIGFQGASGDITATANGLASTALDFTTLGLTVGQWVKIGGAGSAFRFGVEALNGWARITAIAVNALTLDNLPSGWATNDGSGKTLRVFFGDILRNGVSAVFGTIERGFLGQGTPTYIAQRGMEVGQMSLEYTTEQIVTGSFTFMGLTGSEGIVPLDASPDPAPTNPFMSANVNVGRIAESGSVIGSPNWARAFTISVNNNLRMLPALGNVGAVDINAGDSQVTGRIETYFGSNALLTKLLAGTVGSLNARVQKADQAIITTLPRVTFTAGSPSAGAKNQDVTLPLDWTASRDTATNCQIQFDRLEYYEA